MDISFPVKELCERLVRERSASYIEYLDSVGEDSVAFVKGSVDSIEPTMTSMFDEVSTRLSSVVTASEEVVSSTTSLAISLVVADPVAPIASAGVITSSKGTVSSLRSSLSSMHGDMSAISGTLERYGMLGFEEVSSVITTVSDSISTASSAVDALPI